MLKINVFNQKLGKYVCFEITALYALENELRYRHDMKNFMVVDFEVTDAYSDYYGYTTFNCTACIETDTQTYQVVFELSEAGNDEYNVHISELKLV